MNTADVLGELQRLREALRRPIEVPDASSTYAVWRIVQRCPICSVELGLQTRTDDDTLTARWLRRELFAVYDNHRCQQALDDALREATPAKLEELYEHTERESIRMAERAQVIADPDLRARAERESGRLLEWAEALKKKIASW